MSSDYRCSFASFVPNMNQLGLTQWNDSSRRTVNKGSVCKNPGLTLSVPENPIKYQISVVPGSPLTADKVLNLHSNSHRGERVGSRITFAPDVSSMLYDESSESDTDSEYEESLAEDEDDAQYISIPSTSPFYHPPPKIRPCAYGFCDVSFSCDAVAEEGSFQMQPPTLFNDSWEDGELPEPDIVHEKRFQLSVPGISENNLCLMRPLLTSSEVWELASLKPLPDVPQGIELEYDYDSDSESSCCNSNDGAEARNNVYISKSPVCAIAPPLDSRLVTPFVDYRRRNSRASIVSKSSFRGHFFKKETLAGSI
ncbi:hypothetical protein GGU11DRAFT_790061 [Lentinula aff. detonsa]|nr:hypothetical protein GGU11DRAFT_790061 [Lentinula aff. detonsa]